MSAILLDGDALAGQRFKELADRTGALVARGVAPRLATVLVGDDTASQSYIDRKHQTCASLGIASDDIRLPGTISEVELLETVALLNADPAVHGVLVQLPLPAHIDEIRVGEAISPAKDVDGLHPVNLGRLLAGAPGLLPCTPAGILDLLRHHDVPLSGRRVAILGRGMLVGRPLAMLLSLRGTDAEVTLLHSRSRDLAEVTRTSDVVIAAVGHPGLITAEMVRPGAAVVGVGITYIDGKMVSDIAEDVAGRAGWVTPLHGSVGAMTRAHLIVNLLRIAEKA